MRYRLDAISPTGAAVVMTNPDQAAAFALAHESLCRVLKATPRQLWLTGDTGSMGAVWGTPDGVGLCLLALSCGETRLGVTLSAFAEPATVRVPLEDWKNLGDSDAIFALAARATTAESE